ncbi:MAG: 3-methyl-2-oxobutanoate hydroxymethyltransferase [Verrucomicrobiota bacterium]
MKPTITPADLRAMKARREKIAALTAYDFPTAKLLDECDVPLLLVGDSLGMVVLGYPNTTHVTMADMEHHTRAATRGATRALIGSDLPFHAYDSPEQALENARKLVAAGAHYVKAEGGREILPQIQAIVNAGIPFLGHIGMLPQHVLEEGGKYRIKGRDDAGHAKLLDDAAALAEAGAFAVVLELVTPAVAKEITDQFPFATIGIGSGPDCDGQILVTPDLIGTYPWFTPKFVKQELNAAEQIRAAIGRWKSTL